MSSEEISDWYALLDARVLDLVGDYAGRELFLLEGDSLVLQCLDDRRLDFHDGFQLLQAVWNVERFLLKLLTARCCFNIVFFDENSELVACAASNKKHASKYKLAREVIIRHLKTNLGKSHPHIDVRSFPSIHSVEFEDYLRTVNVYFVMCHNGALAAKGGNLESSSESWLLLVKGFMNHRYNVALINEIEWRDSKIITRVLQAKVVRNHISLEGSVKRGAKQIAEASIGQHIDALIGYQEQSFDLDLTAGERLVLLAVSATLLKKHDRWTNFIAAAIMLHLAFLQSLALSERRLPIFRILPAEASSAYDDFLNDFSEAARIFIRHPAWEPSAQTAENSLHDIVDGRLLRCCIAILSDDNISFLGKETTDRFELLLDCLHTVSEGTFHHDWPCQMKTEKIDIPVLDHEKHKLLPFSNAIFDKHLADVCIDFHTAPACDKATRAGGVREFTHWHNRKPLDPKRFTPSTTPRRVTKWNNPVRRSQLQMREMIKYAASLTNTKGNALRPTTITSRRSEPVEEKKSTTKKNRVIQENKERKARRDESQWLDAWKRKLDDNRKMSPNRRLMDMYDYLDKLEDGKERFLGTEVRAYAFMLLILQWQSATASAEYAVKIWDQMRVLRTLPGLMTKSCHTVLVNLCSKLGLPSLPLLESTIPDRPLSFPANLESVKSQSLSGGLNFHAFQLLHCGPYMDRYTNSKPDRRVEFEPDEWQRKVLDELDAKRSVFVVAPTSAGKTFISFYAMEQILREDDEGVLVYVAPTKALVNQIAAEIHGRFSKSYQKKGQSVWAIHTRDTRVHNPNKCQILVTVPHILQIMLLAPSNATTWAPRVKCIIFDEIHSIGQADDGLVWEQLLLLAPCRIIALSATVGNPDEFTDWLSSTQRTLGVPLTLIRHNHRFSDLRKFVFYPQQSVDFMGLPKVASKEGILESECIPGLSFVHPIASLVTRGRKMPEDLSLEPQDCYSLWRCMVRHQSSRFPVPAELNPQEALSSSFIRKADVYSWEQRLKEVLSDWMLDPESPFDNLRIDLQRGAQTPMSFQEPDEKLWGEGKPPPTDIGAISKDELCRSVFPLLVGLHGRNALPAILFNYERTTCERLAISVFLELQTAEEKYKEGPVWKQKLKDFETRRAAVEKMERKLASTVKKPKKTAADDRGSQSKEQSVRDAAGAESHPLDNFDSDIPLDQFTFADFRKITWAELMDEIQELEGHHINPLLLEALKRGIGVHHSGLNRRYRLLVERLFRLGFLRVIIATGTLALGINMPCATVVFCGDSVYLTALNFRQAAGRAGRRGFDLLGNVIFHGIPLSKVYQLISSRLPDLNGHFPITTSLVLRLFILLHNSNESVYAAAAINSLLSQARLCLGGQESKVKVLHHLRFSIEYLRRQHLLGSQGEPIDFACGISHLYFTERSGFAFHALLRAGYFDELCRSYGANTDRLMRHMMMVLAHLFGRQSLGSGYRKKQDLKSPSIVALPDMDPKAANVIRAHNQEILKTFSACVETFAMQHLEQPEDELPLTGVHVGGSGNNVELCEVLGAMDTNISRSAFVGLSGHGDEFDSVSDLCETARSGVILEQSAIPHLDLYPDDTGVPLNAYLYDFFCHGSLEPLETANSISRSDAWFVLNDFSLVLATIVTSLQNYLDPELADKFNPADAAGAGDSASLENESGNAADSDDSDTDSDPPPTRAQETVIEPAVQRPSAKSHKNIIPESWDEESDDAEEEDCHVEESKEGDPVVSLEVLKSFYDLQQRFDEKFRGIFA